MSESWPYLTGRRPHRGEEPATRLSECARPVCMKPAASMGETAADGQSARPVCIMSGPCLGRKLSKPRLASLICMRASFRQTMNDLMLGFSWPGASVI